MKLKFKQNIFIVNLGRTVETREEVEINNKVQAKSFIDAGFAEEIIEEEKPAKKPNRRKVKDGE